MKRLAVPFLLALATVASSALADPMVYELPAETAELKPGLGIETAVVCTKCHSADYITTQPRGEGKAFWQAEVQKMIKVYKAPIGEDDAAVIANYLAATY